VDGVHPTAVTPVCVPSVPSVAENPLRQTVFDFNLSFSVTFVVKILRRGESRGSREIRERREVEEGVGTPFAYLAYFAVPFPWVHRIGKRWTEATLPLSPDLCAPGDLCGENPSAQSSLRIQCVFLRGLRASVVNILSGCFVSPDGTKG